MTLETFDDLPLVAWNLVDLGMTYRTTAPKERLEWLKDYEWGDGLEDLLLEGGHSTYEIARLMLTIARCNGWGNTSYRYQWSKYA